MAYTTIDKPSDFFNTLLYTGTGSEHAISGVGFTPNMVWLKCRSNGANHWIFDTVRGATKNIYPSSTAAEATEAQSLKSFASDGYTLGTESDINGSSRTNVSWNWKAGTSFTNDASSTGVGSIDSSGSVNTDAGFSIVKWTGGGANATIAHGLGVAPSMIITKVTNEVYDWYTYHKSLDATDFIKLNATSATSDNATLWQDTEPTTTVFSTGTAFGSYEIIAYCFADIQGYSKFGSYTGNGNADGTFVYTGFKPAWVMIKRTDSSNSWLILDNKRIGYNPDNEYLLADTTDAEGTDNFVDLYSNGFKIMSADAAFNASGGTYIYMAFAENPFVTSGGVPATAK